MGNLATLRPAPPFTSETAKIYAVRATQARVEKRREEILAFDTPNAQKRAQKQVLKVMRWMEKECDRKEYGRLAAILDRLWNKAFPTQGAVKSRSTRREREAIQPLETQPAGPVTPQAPPQAGL
jgi:hypothetical protein